MEGALVGGLVAQEQGQAFFVEEPSSWKQSIALARRDCAASGAGPCARPGSFRYGFWGRIRF